MNHLLFATSSFELNWGTLVMIGMAVVHICFTIGVWRDSEELQTAGRRMVLVNDVVWALATLLGGLSTAAIYWVLHHSTLRKDPPPAA